MQLLGDAADNPDQRIAEDINLFIEKGLYLGLGLLNAVVTLGSFVVILWGLSASAPFILFGINWAIPGYLVWAALIYSIVGTAITHWIGRRADRLNFMQQRLRGGLPLQPRARARKLRADRAARPARRPRTERLLERFGRVVGNWMLIMRRTKRLTFFTASFSQASMVFPYAVVEPGLFRGHDPARRADADRVRVQQRAEVRCRSLPARRSTASLRNGAR